MKIVVNEDNVSPKKVIYPRLMIGDKGSVIEVFKEPNDDGESFVIVRRSVVTALGARSSFQVLNGAEQFVDFNGSITLSND